MKNDTSKKIVDYIEKNTQSSPKELVDYLGITKQAVFRHLLKLIENKIIFKTGKPPKVFYFINKTTNQSAGQAQNRGMFIADDMPSESLTENITLKRSMGKINMQTNLTNKFFDINKFPSMEGMLVFPVSMSRISNESQNAKKYWEYIRFINPSKVDKSKPESKLGVIFIYGDYLYMYSDEKATILKRRYMDLVTTHRNSFGNLVKGDPYLILDAFSYKVWNQFYVDYDKFIYYLTDLKKIYQEDDAFKKYIKKDFENLENKAFKLDDNQINFFLEEHLMLYLISKGVMKLENKFINNQQKWILIAYPGKPLLAHIYLHQKNFFKLDNSQNPYQDSWYDLEAKKLYNFQRIDLGTIEF